MIESARSRLIGQRYKQMRFGVSTLPARQAGRQWPRPPATLMPLSYLKLLPRLMLTVIERKDGLRLGSCFRHLGLRLVTADITAQLWRCLASNFK